MSASPDGKLHGEKKTDLHAAYENAWGKRQPGDPEEYIVDEIHVYGNNPITGYSVVLRRPS